MTDEWLLIYNTLIAVRLRLYRMTIHSLQNFSFHSDSKRASKAMKVLYLANSRNQCFNRRTCYERNSLYYIRIVSLLNIVFFTGSVSGSFICDSFYVSLFSLSFFLLSFSVTLISVFLAPETYFHSIKLNRTFFLYIFLSEADKIKREN